MLLSIWAQNATIFFSERSAVPLFDPSSLPSLDIGFSMVTKGQTSR
jgi:hypothetical protein